MNTVTTTTTAAGRKANAQAAVVDATSTIAAQQSAPRGRPCDPEFDAEEQQREHGLIRPPVGKG